MWRGEAATRGRGEREGEEEEGDRCRGGGGGSGGRRHSRRAGKLLGVGAGSVEKRRASERIGREEEGFLGFRLLAMARESFFIGPAFLESLRAQ